MNNSTKLSIFKPMNIFAKCSIFFALVSMGCNSNTSPDVSSITVDARIFRTEVDLSQTKNIGDLQALIDKNPSFYEIYLNEILGAKGLSRDSQLLQLEQLFKDSLTIDLINKSNNKYNDLNKIKKNIDQLFRHLKYYWPESVAQVPNFYTFISQFGYQVFVFEDNGGKDGIGIGLDMFLSPDVPYKMVDPKNTSFSDYITRSWNADHIIKKIADLYVNDIVGDAAGHRLVDQMIHNGKSLYLTKLLLPETHDSVIIEYPLVQLEWCKNNELSMWTFFMENKLFFESNPAKIGKYLNPSPNSPEMPAEAPGRTANYIGWQIVKAYMKKYPETTPAQLLSLNDAQKLMEKSKYKPERK